MVDYTIEYMSWCNVNGHDKVWGYISLGQDSRLYNFWGRRGKKYVFKMYKGSWSYDTLAKIAIIKERPGRKNGTYQRLSRDIKEIEKIVPNFEEELLSQLTLAKLFDNFHRFNGYGARDE